MFVGVRVQVGVLVSVGVGVRVGLLVAVGVAVGATALLKLTSASAHCLVALRLFGPPAVKVFGASTIVYSGNSSRGGDPLVLPADPATVAPSFAGPSAPPAVSPE